MKWKVYKHIYHSFLKTAQTAVWWIQEYWLTTHIFDPHTCFGSQIFCPAFPPCCRTKTAICPCICPGLPCQSLTFFFDLNKKFEHWLPQKYICNKSKLVSLILHQTSFVTNWLVSLWLTGRNDMIQNHNSLFCCATQDSKYKS